MNNNSFNFTPIAFLAVFWCSMFSLSAYSIEAVEQEPSSSATQTASDQPNSALSPQDVTRLQLDALKNNDQPKADSGIATTFRFASPGNQTATGPIERFSLIFQNPAYAPMLNHLKVQYGDLQIDGETAVQPVIITSRTGQRVGYFFFLSKQRGGEYDQCWMTDSVVPFEVEQSDQRETQVI